MLKNSQSVLHALARQFSLSARVLVPSKVKAKSTVQSLAESPKDEVNKEEPPNAFFLERAIGANYRKWGAVLEKHPELKSVKRRDIVNSSVALKSLNFVIGDILQKPMILYSNALTLENRYQVLRECGFEHITISMLAKYVTVMNKTVEFLKSRCYMPSGVDVLAQLRNCFTDVDVRIPADCQCSESMELKLLRQQVLNSYLRQRLDMSDKDIEKQWKVYGRVRHKSFKSVQEIVHMLLEELHFSKERINKNAYLLYGDVDNVRRIIAEIGTIDGQDVREIGYIRPKILMSPCDSLKKTLEHVKSFGIGEQAILRCLEVLTLGPDTVLERLQDLKEIAEFNVLASNPRVLRLVHYQNKARLRLEYLSQLKVRCASLHILSCDSTAFAKFAREGSDRTKGCDIVVFLADIMQKPEQNIRDILVRHPNWCHIPVAQVKQCYEFLRSKRFPVDDIYNNIHLLLYPIKRIEEKLLQLKSPDFLEEHQLHSNLHQMSDNEALTLVLYLIECEFHFTGDGIWTEHHTQQVENFHNLLPDFPESLNKVYKYGVKPANHEHRENLPV